MLCIKEGRFTDEWSSFRGREEEGLHCVTCQVTATSEEQMAVHKEGKRHRRHLAIAELQEAGPTTDPAEGSEEQDLHCDLCHVTAPSAQHRAYHLRQEPPLCLLAENQKAKGLERKGRNQGAQV